MSDQAKQTALLERLLLSVQALSQIHIHTDEIIPLGEIVQLPAVKAINRGTSMIAPSGQQMYGTRAELSTGSDERTRLNTLPLTYKAAFTACSVSNCYSGISDNSSLAPLEYESRYT